MAVDAAFPLGASTLVRREATIAAGLAGVVGALLVAFGPPAGDAAAHLYRTELVREGVLVWDGSWYAGHYPLASYSVLFYLPAAVVGPVAVAFLGCVAAASLFAALTIRLWGDAAVLSSRVFAVLAAAPLFTGTYSFAAGTATALGALVLLERGRTVAALACAFLTAAFSPLAFLFLCLVLVAVAIDRRPGRRRLLAVGGGLAAIGGLALGLALAFPAEGRFGFRWQELSWALIACGIGAALAWRAPRARVLALVFVALGIACVVAFLVPSPVGSNVTRFRTAVLPLAILVVSLRGFRPWSIVLPALGAAAFYSVSPFVAVATGLGDTRAASASFWQPVVSFVRAQGSPDYRVDVVPTFDNWEAYHLPREGVALTRGWYRQLDLAANEVLYGDDLTGAAYRAWLRSVGARFVVLPLTTLDRVAAEPQAALLRSGRSGLREVARLPGAIVYELPDATPVLSGPAAARLTVNAHDRLEGEVAAPGRYLLRVRWTPFLAVEAGDVCLERAPGGMTALVARRAGPFALAVPGPGEVLATALGRRHAAC